MAAAAKRKDVSKPSSFTQSATWMDNIPMLPLQQCLPLGVPDSQSPQTQRYVQFNETLEAYCISLGLTHGRSLPHPYPCTTSWSHKFAPPRCSVSSKRITTNGPSQIPIYSLLPLSCTQTCKAGSDNPNKNQGSVHPLCRWVVRLQVLMKMFCITCPCVAPVRALQV